MIARVDAQNDLLRSELGAKPLYQWKHTSTLYFHIQKVVENESSIDPQWDYIANPETGIVELKPVYVRMPMMPLFQNHWILAKYVKADQEEAFRQRFGTRVEYPRDGIWQPINTTVLREGITPSMRDTWAMIHAVRANRNAVEDWFRNGEAKQDKIERAASSRRKDMIRDRFTVGLEIPGTKGAVSLFNASPTDNVTIKNSAKESIQ